MSGEVKGGGKNHRYSWRRGAHLSVESVGLGHQCANGFRRRTHRAANTQTNMSLERAVRAKLAGKRDANQEKEAQTWIEQVVGKKFPPGDDYDEVLKDGTVLCELMNKISPGSVAKINTSGGQFKMMENINLFQRALKAYGVADVDVFQTVDLWEKKDISQVTSTIFALGRQTYRHPEWQGPFLGPKPSEECKREFTEEQMKAGQTIIGLQAGQNKGATQAGSAMGSSRKIILGK